MEVQDSIGNKNITFRVKNHPEDDYKTFHNLIMKVSNDGNTSLHLLKYQMTHTFANDYLLGTKTLAFFNGNINQQDLYPLETTPPTNPCDSIITPIGGMPLIISGGNNSFPVGSPNNNGGEAYETPTYVAPNECWKYLLVSCCHNIHYGESTQCNCTPGNQGAMFLVNACTGFVGQLNRNATASEPCDPVGQVGILTPDEAKECYKITNLYNTVPNLKSKMKELSNTENLNLSYEQALVTVVGNSAVGGPIAGSQAYPEVAIDYTGVAKLSSIYHNHPTTTPESLSIFSPSDFIGPANFLLNGKLNANFFVSFLGTKKGTRYAYTISDPQKFMDFFFYSAKGSVMKALDEKERYYSSGDKFRKVYDKYYNIVKNPNCKIKNTDTDNENVLKEFLNFMKEGDIGITLLESTDNFETFKIVTQNQDGTPKRQPCN
jgi:hypothetical protein